MSAAAPSAFASRGLAAAGRRLVRLADHLQARTTTPNPGPTLAGDRSIEWAWCASQLPEVPGLVLDFGAGNGNLSATAAFRGHRVVAVDLLACEFEFELSAIEYRQGDFAEMEFEPGSFDHVINCSTIEHVGLGGRYSGSQDDADGDLRAMERLASLLKPDGNMGLTLPVGQDAVFAPLHRVYGHDRLPALLSSFEVVAERYFAKRVDHSWREVDRDSALAEPGSRSYYALGLFSLRRAQLSPA